VASKFIAREKKRVFFDLSSYRSRKVIISGDKETCFLQIAAELDCLLFRMPFSTIIIHQWNFFVIGKKRATGHAPL